MSDGTPLLEVRDLSVDYTVSPTLFGAARRLQAVRQVSFRLGAGETLGIVGESGCGKSTLARALVGLVAPTAGTIVWRNRELSTLSNAERHTLRRDMQIVFQDPFSSLDPRMRIAEIVAEPLSVLEGALASKDVAERVGRNLDRVGLAADFAERFPHQLSGGQCQRVAIARALIAGPKLLICDEPVSSLDVSVQAQIVNLLKGLQRDLGLSLIFISHNMAVVRQMSARVLVMYLGRGVEHASREAVFEHPRHPYTRALLAAVPEAIPGRSVGATQRALTVEMPSALHPPSGCVFRTRCEWAAERCAREIPAWEDVRGGAVACHRWREM